MGAIELDIRHRHTRRRHTTGLGEHPGDNCVLDHRPAEYNEFTNRHAGRLDCRCSARDATDKRRLASQGLVVFTFIAVITIARKLFRHGAKVCGGLCKLGQAAFSHHITADFAGIRVEGALGAGNCRRKQGDATGGEESGSK
ncbi:MAG: hypothetical protein EXR85_00595 [Xanthomonadales bacterium]|nr:hypothetical protein [Xanthomonadales bacterium]